METPTTPPPATVPETQPAPATAPEPPPATKIVVTGTKTEREIELENRLAAVEAEKRKAETDAAYAQDEARRLRELQTAPPPSRVKSKTASFGWFQAEED